MKSNKKGFAIMIAMVLVILITLVALVILSFIMPFSKNVKGIENTTLAYYNGYKGIESGLYHINQIRTNLTTESGRTNISNGSGYKFNTFSSGTTIPQIGYGNSEFSGEYNIISLSEPIQLEIGRKSHLINNLGNSNINFVFKVPNFDKNSLTTETLSGNTATPIINWMLSSQNDTLISSGSYVYVGTNQINNSNGTTTWNIRNKSGIRLNGISQTFGTFYQANCNGTASGCTLKMSVINDLVLNSGNTQIPYLEYKITFPGRVPDRYSRISSYGLSKGFQKKLDVRVPQQTVNSALDFTVFQ